MSGDLAIRIFEGAKSQLVIELVGRILLVSKLSAPYLVHAGDGFEEGGDFPYLKLFRLHILRTCRSRNLDTSLLAYGACRMQNDQIGLDIAGTCIEPFFSLLSSGKPFLCRLIIYCWYLR